MRPISCLPQSASIGRLAAQSLQSHRSISLSSPVRSLASPRRTTIPRHSFAPFKRYNSALTVPGAKPAREPEKRDEPSYELSFVCKPCLYRSSHRITKHGYHHGTVLVTCPSCKSRHVIADHLKVFLDEKSTLEDILRKKAANGEDFTRLLKKGKLGLRPGDLVGNEGEEDVEFWEDGTETTHTPMEEKQAMQEDVRQGHSQG